VLMLKLPYGLSNFAEIRKNNYLYVDKTQYIELLESYGERYIFFLRPRRFGKTLWLSTLEHYYDLAKKDDFDELFSDLYIGQNKSSLASNYHILKFDFSGIERKDKLEEDFFNEIQTTISSFMDKYEFNFEFRETDNAHSYLQNFLSKLDSQTENNVYLLIDEYDHFANELLSFESSEFNNIFSKGGFVRKFFEVLKKKTTSGIIERIFATGVTPIALDSMTSGFNIASDLTTDSNLNQLLGFTDQEVKAIIDQITEQKKEKEVISFKQRFKEDPAEYIFFSQENFMEKLKEYYNGYSFSPEAENKVFNSDMILYYFNSWLRNSKEPLELIDKNISSDYFKLEQLFSIKNRKNNFEVLKSILKAEIQQAKLSREFNLNSRFNREDFISLLFYLGFLTISGREFSLTRFEIPNYAVKELYFDYFAEIISRNSHFEIETLEIKKSIIQLAKNGQISSFVKLIEKTLSKVSNRDFINFDEKYIKILMLSYLMLPEIYNVKSEYEVKNGYVDIALFKRVAEVKYEAIIELKYLKQSDYSKTGRELLEQTAAAARQQIKNYLKAEELQERNNLKSWIVIFAGSEAVYLEEVE
jgi:hypothetical protein